MRTGGFVPRVPAQRLFLLGVPASEASPVRVIRCGAWLVEHGDQVDAAVRIDDHAGEKIGKGDLVDGEPGGVHADLELVEKQGLPFEKIVGIFAVDGGKPIESGLARVGDCRCRLVFPGELHAAFGVEKALGDDESRLFGKIRLEGADVHFFHHNGHIQCKGRDGDVAAGLNLPALFPSQGKIGLARCVGCRGEI